MCQCCGRCLTHIRQRQTEDMPFVNFFWNRFIFLFFTIFFDCDDYIECCSDAIELADIDWDNLGFGIQPTDYMYFMKCDQGGTFSKGELKRFGNIELNPSAGVLNYGQVSYIIHMEFMFSYT